MDNIICTPLKRISNVKGDIWHAMKKSADGYVDFGEAYFTSIVKGETKGWKKHQKMTLNLIVPVGSVTFYLYNEKTQITHQYLINQDNYCRLTVSPGLWMAFHGEGESLNLILNIASIEHDPDEALNMPLETFPLD